MSLESKIIMIKSDMPYGGYFTKYILERVFDKIVEWITFNHIENSDAYISCKQKEIRYLVYSLGPSEEFKNQQFQDRMDRWVKEIILELLEIRKLYLVQEKKGN